ncbi:MAG: tyrosine--tRNA ligase [Acidimicrobiales bacterium]|nr:tyrosine--tRNA ligase [Acidimicrobiales bacterium]
MTVAVDTALIDDLRARGLVQDSTNIDELASRLSERPVRVYVGFDPTADSLHVGNLVGLLMLRRFQDAGHNVIVLAGGATGMVGDPSGRSSERSLLDDAQLAANIAGILPQLRQFLDFERTGNPATLLDNRAWTVGVTYLQFLRDVGKFITVNQMVAKDSVRSRMESTDGISYTEFSYMLLQAHDFAWLYEHEGCEMQMGGSDQWGNIVAGIDLIRKKLGGHGLGLTFPLLTGADGSKYGKTAGGETIWLSGEKFSPYAFYQTWKRVEDSEIEKLLLQLTLLPVHEVGAVMGAHREAPHRRLAQTRLAEELTSLVHGADATDGAREASEAVFGGSVTELGKNALEMLSTELPTHSASRTCLGQAGAFVPLLTEAGVTASNSEANRLLKQNGLSVNDVKVAGDHVLDSGDLLHGRYALVRKGKKHLSLLVFDKP